MTYAPYQNDRREPSHQGLILGQFLSSETDVLFEYARRTDDGWLLSKEFPHQIFVTDSTRYALIKKTIAYIVVDEAADGSPVVERWPIKRHQQYATDD